MKTIQNETDYNQVINSSKPALLDFYADWCGPCRALLPTVEKLATEHESAINIAKINVDNNQELAAKFGVRSIPALFFIKDGEIKEHLSGVQSESDLRAKILKYSN
jgi:thioredoxin